MLGTENLEQLCKGVIDLADTAGDALDDGKINLSDIPLLLGLAETVNKFKGAKDALKEAGDLDQSEVEYLRESLKEYLSNKNSDAADDKIETVAGNAIDAGIAIGKLVGSF